YAVIAVVISEEPLQLMCGSSRGSRGQPIRRNCQICVISSVTPWSAGYPPLRYS
ncbi:hypothetical protein GE061_016540, partial [Apolygus lucorum]